MSRFLSLGAGVQSSALALMAERGLVGKFDAAVFADTGAESVETYEWLERLEGLLSFPVVRVEAKEGPLLNWIFKDGFSQIPAFRVNRDGYIGIGKRQCTNHAKLKPIRDYLRAERNGSEVVVAKGISVDEVSRAKDSSVQWMRFEYPLLDARRSRCDCRAFLDAEGCSGVVKSGCWCCPFRSDSQWAASREKASEWSQIVDLDRELNKRGEFLHSSCQPIDEVRFRVDGPLQLNLFENECEGVCGV